VVVWAGRFKHIDVPMGHPMWSTIEFNLDRPDQVCFAYHTASSDARHSERVEVRLKTPQAQRLAELVTQPA
jgi:hypothetical protein